MSVSPVVFGFCKRQVVRLHSLPTLSCSVSSFELVPLSPGGGGASNRPRFCRLAFLVEKRARAGYLAVGL